jgi:hypothetical protein
MLLFGYVPSKDKRSSVIDLFNDAGLPYPLSEEYRCLPEHADDLFGSNSLACHLDLLTLSRFENTNSTPGLVLMGQVSLPT